jgi:hypothetical protein
MVDVLVSAMASLTHAAPLARAFLGRWRRRATLDHAQVPAQTLRSAGAALPTASDAGAPGGPGRAS